MQTYCNIYSNIQFLYSNSMLKLDQRQEIKISHEIKMTQSMQLSLKILSLSNIELTEEINNLVSENPFIEQEEPEYTSNNADYYNLYNTKKYSTEIDFDQISKETKSLKEHILDQINICFFDETELSIAYNLLDFLEDRGYLQEGAIDYCTNSYGEISVDSVLQKLRNLDPSGVFARDIKECLAMQLKDKNIYDEYFEILLNNLELVAKYDITKLSKISMLKKEKLDEYLKIIKSLNPKPGNNFSSEENASIAPDIFVYKDKDGAIKIELNNHNLPKILVNKTYANIIKNTDDMQIQEKYNYAKNFVKSIEQRAITLLKVASYIIEYQIEYFEYGVRKIRPLTLEKVALALELHESTISRVCGNKYILSPSGLLPMKFFFAKSIDLASGNKETSNKAISGVIKELINNEDNSKPLSDEDIVEILSKRNIKIARRTVAKYRTSMKIPSSYERCR